MRLIFLASVYGPAIPTIRDGLIWEIFGAAVLCAALFWLVDRVADWLGR